MGRVRVLVLGGGGFLGHHVAAEAVGLGHEVTVFNRNGRSSLPEVEVLTGDRNDSLDALAGREWDAAVDTFTDTEPDAPAVRRAAELLSGSVGTYCYVSGMSVYAPDGPSVPDERAPVRQPGREPRTDPLQARSLAKLAGEAAVTDTFDGVVLIPRVGIMVGPRDPSQRFTWWPMRFLRARAGDAPATVSCPGRPDRFVQYSDARDIARWLVTTGLAARGGTFNTVGPLRRDTLAAVLAECRDAAGDVFAEQRPGRTEDDPPVTLRWHEDEHALHERLQDVTDEDRPLWYPEHQIPQQAIDSSAAHAAGLRFRPARETAIDTLRWALDRDPDPLPHFPEP